MPDSKTSAPPKGASHPPVKGDKEFPVPDAGTFQQREPRPEDYPASAKVTPPALQLNPALATAVGEPSLPGRDPASAPIKDGIEAHEKVQDKAHDHAQRIADAKADLKDLESQQV